MRGRKRTKKKKEKRKGKKEKRKTKREKRKKRRGGTEEGNVGGRSGDVHEGGRRCEGRAADAEREREEREKRKKVGDSGAEAVVPRDRRTPVSGWVGAHAARENGNEEAWERANERKRHRQ